MVGHFSRQRAVEAQRSTWFLSVLRVAPAVGVFVVCSECAARKLKTESNKKKESVINVSKLQFYQNCKA